MIVSDQGATRRRTAAGSDSVSIVVPTFKRPEGLRRCVEGIARLDYPTEQMEVIVVDDGGGGVTAEWLTTLAHGVRIRFIAQDRNAGPAAARNVGARAATGALIAFVDDDCQPRPTWLLELTRTLAVEPTALVGGHVVNALSRNLFAEASQELVSYLYESFSNTKALLPFFTANNMACRRDLFLRMGGFDDTFRFSAAEDRELSERWAGAGGPLRHVPEAVVEHYHALSPTLFVRQHHYYGRGAVHLARRRSRWVRPEPVGFYVRMLAYPVRRHGWRRGSAIAALIGVAQVVSATGMLAAVVSRWCRLRNLRPGARPRC